MMNPNVTGANSDYSCANCHGWCDPRMRWLPCWAHWQYLAKMAAKAIESEVQIVFRPFIKKEKEK